MLGLTNEWIDNDEEINTYILVKLTANALAPMSFISLSESMLKDIPKKKLLLANNTKLDKRVTMKKVEWNLQPYEILMSKNRKYMYINLQRFNFS